MNSLQYKKSQLKLLCTIIGSTPGEIEYITDHIDDYYTEWFEKKVNKATGDFKKYKDGSVKQRSIRPSLNRLKSIQVAIKNKILAPIPLPNSIHGGRKGRNNVTNAKPHQGNKFKFTTDLQEFYPNIKSDRVYQTFLYLGYSNHFSCWLTKLTTWKHELPQGTPTSTHIANLAFLRTDFKLISLCQKNNLTYTRYVDDLTFSSQQDFKPILNDILDEVITDGFKISYRKTIYKGIQNVTGIDIYNNYIDAPKKIKIKAASEALSQDGMKPFTNYINTIRRTNKNIKENKEVNS